jgi:hypothetical protein
MNPYLADYLAVQRQDSLEAYLARTEMVVKYSWAIPSDEALRVIGCLGPIVEGGAGNGYWASLLRAAQVDVIAYDKKPPRVCWTDVKVGNAEAITQHSDRTLMLCWPPYATSMAKTHLQAYRGTTVIYIGEGHYGCTGDDTFHEMLEAEWTCEQHLAIPQWEGLHDFLSVWRRR